MKTRISLVFVALVAALTIPAVASANGGGHHGPPPPPPIVTVLYAQPIIAGSGNATISATSVSCAAGDGSYTVTWTAHITDLSRHNTPTTWALGGTVAAVSDPITVTTSHMRQSVLFSTPPRIAIVAVIGMSRPVLTASAGVPDYCTT